MKDHNQPSVSDLQAKVNHAKYAFAALAVLKSIMLGIAIESGVLGGILLWLEIALVVVAAVVTWQMSNKPTLWLVIGIGFYILEIGAFFVDQPKSLVGGFFLKAGVLFFAIRGLLAQRDINTIST